VVGASDLTLVRGGLRAVADAIRCPPHVGHHRRQPVLGVAYNVADIPIAASGYLNPVLAAAGGGLVVGVGGVQQPPLADSRPRPAGQHHNPL
jgi:cation transport ATPase